MRYGISLLLAVTLLLPSTTSAATMVTDPGTGAWRTLNPGTAGMQFTVAGSMNLTVTALGFIDQNKDGLATSHFVGIWNSAGTKLAEISVGGGGDPGTLVGDHRYVDLTAPIELTVGQTYIIGGQTTGTSDLFRDAHASSVFSSEFTNLAGRWIQEGTGGWSRPTNQGASPGYMAPNMIFAVPEPTVIAPLTLAGLGLLARRRRSA